MKWKYIAIRHVGGRERIVGIHDTEDEAWERCAADSHNPDRGAEVDYSVRRKRAY